MEGKYYLCGWRNSNSKVDVWVLKNPKVKATAATFSAADESLAEEICVRYGDGESKREYVPAPPLKGGQKRFLVEVWGDSTAEALNNDGLFSGGQCNVCRAVKGGRTDVMLQINKAPRPKGNGFFVSSGHKLYIFSNDFIESIEELTSNRLQWRNISSNSGGQWKELLKGNALRGVIPKNQKISGWRCSNCRIPRILAYRDKNGIQTHVGVNEFKNTVPEIFAVEHCRGVSLGMTEEFWSKLKLLPSAKGLMSKALGLVLDEDISDLSQLPSYEEYQAKPHSCIS